MAQPIWQTPAGSLGVIPESVFYRQTLYAYDPDGGDVFFSLIAGVLPDGIQVTPDGLISGTPLTAVNVQGSPAPVNRDVTSKFVVRAYTENPISGEILRLADRTFSLTITGNDVPQFVTPAGSLGSYYDSDEVNIQIQYTNLDPDEVVVIKLVAGSLPLGLTLSETGLISGYVAPNVDVNQPAGYDETPIYTEPYDFISSAINRNYEFILEATDGKSSNLRTYSIFVYNRDTLVADDTTITGDNTFVTADETPIRPPFLLNGAPSNLGIYRSNNFFAYQFQGYVFNDSVVQYSISVNQGSGLPPGLTLDKDTGWLYGYIPDQGITEVEYSFNITVYLAESVYSSLTCTATTAGTNTVTVSDSSSFGVGTPVIFSGTTFGGIQAGVIYYVLDTPSSTSFTIAETPTSTSEINLLSASGTMSVIQVTSSRPYPYTLTIIGDIDAEVVWLTDSDLGTVVNGSVSTLRVEAQNLGGRQLTYRLKSGAFNQLPQGLELLPTGEISGRISFNTFAVDGGTTTFDRSQNVFTRIDETTFDAKHTFTVNAYAEDTGQLLYKVGSVDVVNGGGSYSNVNPPVVIFSSPVGASAVTAQAGNVTISGGVITAVALAEQGQNYTSPATITITQGYGGSGAVLEAVMEPTGVRDVVSVYKTFSVTVLREYNKPYQNLLVEAMPPENDRELLASLLTNTDIFIPDYIYRPTDPYFGKATKVEYQHVFGLDPDILDVYVESLYRNHYWKQLVLGQIGTAQALDSAGNVIYEVVYSTVIDNLVNDQGQSVNSVVTLPYPVVDPYDNSSLISQVYPNSLINMRDRVVDVVGQVGPALPLWMTSKQKNGRVLGFVPAWVICYTKPNRSEQIAYYLQQEFGEQLNQVDFKVDRYVLDTSMSRNWDPVTQKWVPTPSMTTFDRYSSPEQIFVGFVDYATELAFADVNNKTLAEIDALGGIDGIHHDLNNNTLIFVKQENYLDYATTNDAWEDSDTSTVIPGGYSVECTATNFGSNTIICSSTADLNVGDPVWFEGNTFGGIVETNPGGFTQVYYILTINSATAFTVTEVSGSATPVSLTSETGTMFVNFGNSRMAIWSMSVDPVTTVVTLTVNEQTAQNQYVQIRKGTDFYGNQLYYSPEPPPGLTRVCWLPLPLSNATETIFDMGSLAFVEPVDMYDPTDQYDKYLVFPKTNILG